MYSEEILKNLISNQNIIKFRLELYAYKMGRMDTPRKCFWVSKKDLLKKAADLDKIKAKFFSA